MSRQRFSRLLPAFGALPAALLLGAWGPAPVDPAPAATATVAEPAAARWSVTAVEELAAAIEDATKEGLTPADYRPQALADAIAAGPGTTLDRVAEATAMALARDYLLGRVQDRQKFDWHIERSAYEAHSLPQQLGHAVAAGKLRGWLQSLLPRDPQYAALRTALAETPLADAPAIARIRANLERWRWLPRGFGDAYLFVNLPTYELKVMRGGIEEASYDVVVGAPRTPTPQLALEAQRVVVNPWWTLPPSVLAEGKRYSSAKGYVYTRAASGKTMIRQKPGPHNALGRIKIDMPNTHAIYLHDTPQKAAFDRTERALSHGCIRVAGIDQLAADLHGEGQVEEALAGDDTRTLALRKTMPVFIVYLTAQAGDDGRIKPLKDIYGRDAALLAALDGGAADRLGGTVRSAAR